ncbi:response regulator [Couchioplanes caeruleus]|uniref:response regulator n=1 Tax=Couchioplanes caeruleus TaxID=56438 RepID=UPI0020C0F3C1|nr:response regulator [Couchioplanes caeruleus]UQU62551.1 response regulator [Couchioplanes caeruleus]
MSDGPILLVEDNPDDVMFTLRAFAKNHIRNEIVVASDGEAALQRLLPDDGTPPLRPALVLLDVNLPKVNGLEVLRRIRDDERTSTLPVVVLTTSNEERDIVESYRLGANSYVRKPVVFGEFLNAANLLGMYWLLVNEPVPPRRGA